VTKGVLAVRDSKNRKKSAVTQTETTLDSARYYEIVSQKDGLLDAVKAKMPWLKAKNIIIQHDGAGPHSPTLGKGKGKGMKSA
jgi:hypothetical protein